MAALVLTVSVSLDGYVTPPDGSTDRVAAGRSADGAAWTLDTVRNAAVHLMGATTTLPEIVFSTSLTSPRRPPDRPGCG